MAVIGASALTINETELDSYFDTCSQSVNNDSCSTVRTNTLIQCVVDRLRGTLEAKFATNVSISIYFDILCFRFQFWFIRFFGGFWVARCRVCLNIQYGKNCKLIHRMCK